MEIFKKTSFLLFVCAIIYSLSILIFWTVDNIFASDNTKISAFGSILGAIGTIAAMFVAIYIFNGWKIQSNFAIRRDYLKDILNLLRNNHVYIEEAIKLILLIKNSNEIGDSDKTMNIQQPIKKVDEDFLNKLEFIMNEFLLFNNNDDENVKKLSSSYYAYLDSTRSMLKRIKQLTPYSSTGCSLTDDGIKMRNKEQAKEIEEKFDFLLFTHITDNRDKVYESSKKNLKEVSSISLVEYETMRKILMDLSKP
ncbi:hypothetical protein ACG9Y7_04160 [Acinetobacter gerneri]|uniref:hypothetical protein n=1 Tax=Acinetobacter gerneri TaxID=202952 RepID=UPI003AF8D752